LRYEEQGVCSLLRYATAMAGPWLEGAVRATILAIASGRSTVIVAACDMLAFHGRVQDHVSSAHAGTN
jgi:hypothetical protein